MYVRKECYRFIRFWFYSMKLNMKFICIIYIVCVLGYLVKYIWLINKIKGDKFNFREVIFVVIRMGVLFFLNFKKDIKNLSVFYI